MAISEDASKSVPITDRERYDAGMRIRRQVLGDAYVDGTLANRNDFNTEFQEMVTRHAWGTIWTRPGLEMKTRSCIVMAMTIALGAWDELRLHVRGGLNNGLTRDEIKEVILQATVYCGAPAGVHAMRVTQEVLAEMVG